MPPSSGSDATGQAEVELRERREQPPRAPGDPEEAEKRGRAVPAAPGPAARSDAPRSALWAGSGLLGDAGVQRGWRRRSSRRPIGRRGKHPKTRPFPRPALSPPPPAEIGRFSCTCARRFFCSLLRTELCCPSEIRLISFTCCFVSGSSLSLVRHSGQRKSSLW